MFYNKHIFNTNPNGLFDYCLDEQDNIQTNHWDFHTLGF